jgi:uncharacterized tellurite resistance protein B-like protein
MSLIDRLRNAFAAGPSGPSDDLTQDQGMAMVESLVRIALADGEFSAEEQSRLRTDLAALPWSFAQGPGAREQLLTQTWQKVAALPPMSDEDFAKGIAGRLPSERMRRRLLSLCTVLAHSDGATKLELGFIRALAKAFEVSPRDLEGLMALVLRLP